jgi:hypothetical protein
LKQIIQSVLFIVCICMSISSSAQILGGGTSFATAGTFSESWLVSCPSGGTIFCNTNAVGCETITTMDACGIAPACATGTTGSDVWFKFYAQTITASIVVNPTSSFDIAIQAFSGTTCIGLTQIGCTDIAGANATEILALSGLTPGQLYHFRIFGATNTTSQRTGNYTFCGTTGLRSTTLPVVLSALQLSTVNNQTCISWKADAEQEISSYDIEYSSNGISFYSAGTMSATNDPNPHTYTFCDAVKRTGGLYRIKTKENNGEIRYSYSVRVHKTNQQNIQVYPNPVTNFLTVDLPAATSTLLNSYRIITANGYTVQSGIINDNRLIDVHRLAKGIYLLQISNANGVYPFTFQKQ